MDPEEPMPWEQPVANEPPADPYRRFGLADLAVDFLEHMPPEASSGHYIAKRGDRWTGADAHTWAVTDGIHPSHGWRFTIKGGYFQEAHQGG